MNTTLTDDELVERVAQLWNARQERNARRPHRRQHVGITATAARVSGGTLSRLVREGRLVREFDPQAGDSGAYVYRPAD